MLFKIARIFCKFAFYEQIIYNYAVKICVTNWVVAEWGAYDKESNDRDFDDFDVWRNNTGKPWKKCSAFSIY